MKLNHIYNGSAEEVLRTFPDNSINTCITSPPYWQLRSYLPDDHSNKNKELGLEPTFYEFVDNLVKVFDEVRRVLKPEGTCFVNLSDTYSGNKNGKTDEKVLQHVKNIQASLRKKAVIQEKSLCLIPQRFVIAMVDRGWILRNYLIWWKRNAMPSSVKDRFTVDYEPIFFFAKNKKYYFEQQFEKMQSNSYDLERMKSGRKEYVGKWSGNKEHENFGSPRARTQRKQDNVKGKNSSTYKGFNERWKKTQSAFVAGGNKGRNCRAVWDIPTRPSDIPHYAMWPEKLVERMISSGCPENGIVLDPFCGSATTCLVAKKMKRNYIGIEINEKDVKIANNRLAQKILI